MKRRVLAFVIVVCFSVSGCGESSGISQEVFDQVVSERNALKSEVEELKQSANAVDEALLSEMVSKEEYETIVAERDELKEKVEKQKKTISKYKKAEETRKKQAEEAAQAEEQKKNDITARFKYPKAPFTVCKYGGRRWDISAFDIYEMDDRGDYVNIKYSVTGTGDNGVVEFFCYDKNGYQVDTFSILVDTNGTAFRYNKEANVDPSTVKIDIE